MTASPSAGFLILLPVKATTRGKSRLGGVGERRRQLALAMALDTAAAVAAAERVRAVVALVEDDDDGQALAAIGGVSIHRVLAHGLNEAILEGAALSVAAAGPIATLPADLPSLRPEELSGALEWAGQHPFAVVADRDGSGTTLLTAARRELLQPRYGVGSLAAHRAAGAVTLPVLATSGLRRDVDLPDDLGDVTGPRSAALLDRWRDGWDPVAAS